ncbi:MAG: YqgE/AlgH family protein [Ferruginibacter sp.]
MIAPQTGSLLIAEPFLKDPNFMRTVVLICRHAAEEGTFGFTLNKLYHQPLNELVPGLEGFDLPVYIGGPVQMDTLHYIHQYPGLFDDCEKVGNDIYWGGDFEKLKKLIKDGSIDPQHIKFFLGYSGWSSGQLDAEMEEKSWLTVGATERIVFDTPYGDIWKASLQHLGGKYEMMVHFPTDPQLN